MSRICAPTSSATISSLLWPASLSGFVILLLYFSTERTEHGNICLLLIALPKWRMAISNSLVLGPGSYSVPLPQVPGFQSTTGLPFPNGRHYLSISRYAISSRVNTNSHTVLVKSLFSHLRSTSYVPLSLRSPFHLFSQIFSKIFLWSPYPFPWLFALHFCHSVPFERRVFTISGRKVAMLRQGI